MEKYPCNLVVCGLVRNAAENLQRNLARLDLLRPCFRSFRVVIYENDSTDRTKEILAEYGSTREEVFVSMADYGRDPLSEGPFSQHRIDLMARFRNQYLEKLKEYPGTDYVAVIDLDVYHFSVEGFLGCFTETGENWDMKSAFGSNYVAYSLRPVFYDIYAYVPREENPVLELYFKNFNDFKKQQRSLYMTFSKAVGQVPVNSNFNALAYLPLRMPDLRSGIRFSALYPGGHSVLLRACGV
ncbi:MAG: glycosyltransferase family 69 protein [Leadbetterella sp.]|nr:glycosyltransferase family 69 protein [Leadbetterella sp.]